MVPLLAAPIAVVSLASNATAIIDPKPTYAETVDDFATYASCFHPSDSRLYFDVVIHTGDEDYPEGYDIGGFTLWASDDGGDVEYQNSEVMAKRLRVTYGILDHHDFVPTSAVFYSGNSFQYDGEYDSHSVFTDVQAVRFDVDWKVVNDPATRTLSCIVKLDKYRND